MKLWQKIFLTTLALVIILVNATSMIILKNSHDLSLAREQSSAVTRHNYLRVEILNSVVNTKLSERLIMLPNDRMNALLVEVLGPQANDPSSGAMIFHNNDLVYAVNDPGFSTELALLGANEYSSTICRIDDRVFLLVVSNPDFNNYTYQLITFYDITSTYDLFDATFNQMRIVGIVSALVIAGILLLLVRVLLLPLRSLSNTTRQIASGDLERRVPLRGNDELATVAHNFNLMADSIESNVNDLEQLAESRKVFIGNLAHEMKTPLTSILGYADLLRVQRQVSDSARVEYANIIVSETKRLQALSGKLMELLSVGNMKLALEPIDLYELASEITMSLQPIFVARQMNLLCRIPTYNCVVIADRELLQSLILNLVDNAMKASTEGATITIAARELMREQRDVASPTPERRIVVGVIDDGMGISVDQIPQLTEPFYMLDKARTRRHGGAGLGLALCAEIARAHGSELFIESEIGIGTTVSCDFAAAYGHARDMAASDSPVVVVAGGENVRYTTVDEVMWHPSQVASSKASENSTAVPNGEKTGVAQMSIGEAEQDGRINDAKLDGRINDAELDGRNVESAAHSEKTKAGDAL
ncbi:MAG: HAMP domain-containing histidine kinase [Coriobacteriales bacterium]|jgi:signal transduction histidine kinase|nr:HAMP domain-containing histidine kinase [Coriobacteriales bacterium]